MAVDRSRDRFYFDRRDDFLFPFQQKNSNGIRK